MGIDSITKLSFFENGKKTDTKSNLYKKASHAERERLYHYLHQIQQGSKKQCAVCIRNT